MRRPVIDARLRIIAAVLAAGAVLVMHGLDASAAAPHAEVEIISRVADAPASLSVGDDGCCDDLCRHVAHGVAVCLTVLVAIAAIRSRRPATSEATVVVTPGSRPPGRRRRRSRPRFGSGQLWLEHAVFLC